MLNRCMTLTCFATLLLGGVALAQMDSGRPGDVAIPDPPAPVINYVESAPDGEQPALPCAPSGMPAKSEADLDRLDKFDFEPTPLWQQLEALSAADKANAKVRFEPMRKLTSAEHQATGPFSS